MLEIYDTKGKRIYGKNLGELSAGFHRHIWDGETEYGKPLPSGIYFIKITTEVDNRLERVILMK